MKTKQLLSLILLPVALLVLNGGVLLGIGFGNISSFIDFPSVQFILLTTIATVLIGADVLKAPMDILFTVMYRFPTKEDRLSAVRLFSLITVGAFIGAVLGVLIGVVLMLWNQEAFTAEKIGPNSAVAIMPLVYFFMLAPLVLGLRFRALSADVGEE